MGIWFYFHLIVIFTTISFGDQKNDATQYCESETFHPVCGPGHVIWIERALYGRMRIGRCVLADLGHLGCHKNVLELVHERCSGRNECVIRIPDTLLDSTSPCYNELKVYLEATYSCYKIIGENESCTLQVTTNSNIHISSLASNRHDCGSEAQPWIVKTDPGQKISLSLIDNFNPGLNCSHVYGHVYEPMTKRNVTICSVTGDTIVLKGGSNSVEVVLMLKKSAKMNFMLRFSAHGCPDLPPLQDAWVERKNNEAVVGCHSTPQTWHLHCHDNQWIGVVGNCTQHSAALMKESRFGSSSPFFPQEIIVIIVLSVAFLLCAIIVLLGFASFKLITINSNNNQQPQDCGCSKADDTRLDFCPAEVQFKTMLHKPPSSSYDDVPFLSPSCTNNPQQPTTTFDHFRSLTSIDLSDDRRHL